MPGTPGFEMFPIGPIGAAGIIGLGLAEVLAGLFGGQSQRTDSGIGDRGERVSHAVNIRKMAALVR